MGHVRILNLMVLVGVIALVPVLASANHHTWEFTEFFSDATGTVQFIEMQNSNNLEEVLGPWGITSTSGGVFSFGTNLSSDQTANTRILIGTTAFAAQPGARPVDYTLPNGFLDPNGDGISFAGGLDLVNLVSIPTDGVNSVDRNGVTAPNTPTNFAGETGFINLVTGIPALPDWALVALFLLVCTASALLLRLRATER